MATGPDELKRIETKYRPGTASTAASTEFCRMVNDHFPQSRYWGPPNYRTVTRLERTMDRQRRVQEVERARREAEWKRHHKGYGKAV